jgi:uncharacterized membrane protein
MVKLSFIYYLLGAMFAGAAVFNARDRRWSIAGFWGILAVSFTFGDAILAAAKSGTHWPAQATGAGVVALGLLATRTGSSAAGLDDERAATRQAQAARLKNLLFLPALAIPALTIALYLSAKYLHWGGVLDLSVDTQIALIALGVAAALSLVIALAVTRSHPIHGIGESRRLLDTVGWPLVLPITLAMLGSVFNATGVGTAVAQLAADWLPVESRAVCLAAYALGMVVLTVIMGNAFAAFPVITAGIGVPLLVLRHAADPAALGALGMLTGYCGTLLSPLAANFNIVPARLLELRDPYGVIRMQWPTALAMIAANIALMAIFLFR